MTTRRQSNTAKTELEDGSSDSSDFVLGSFEHTHTHLCIYLHLSDANHLCNHDNKKYDSKINL